MAKTRSWCHIIDHWKLIFLHSSYQRTSIQLAFMCHQGQSSHIFWVSFRWEMGQIKNTSCNWGSGNFAMNYFKTFLFLFFCVVVSKVEKSPLSDKVLMFEKWLLYLSLVHILLIITIFSLENGTLGSKGWKNMEMNHWVGCRLRRLKWKSIWRRKEFLKKICFLSIQSREPSFTGRCFHQVHQDGYSTYKHVLKHDAIGFERQFVVRQLDTWFQFEKHLLPLNP